MRALLVFLAALFGWRIYSNTKYNRDFKQLPEEEQRTRRRWL